MQGERRSCIIEGREVLHGVFCCVKDKCFVCFDGNLVETYDNIYGGIAGGGTGGVWDDLDDRCDSK